MSEIRIRSKIWFEIEGQPLLGEGRFRLLSAVECAGSINAAAKNLGISYRKAWSQLEDMEQHAPFPLLERRVGGKGGGESQLTAETQELLKNFRLLREQINSAADYYFAEVFPMEE
ncbi:MAG: winged helix-turn-helix domain-containing protein [Desulfuromusa sp.]|nr:winged helix-turn-helix domain-containing protein [Desulfuromusa sp.]